MEELIATPRASAAQVASESELSALWHRFAADRLAVVGLAIVVVVTLAAIFAPVVAPYDPNYQWEGLRRAKPGVEGHLLGTDEVGRDILSRLIYGGRLSLLVSIVPTVVAAGVALALGLLAGYHGGWVDQIIMRVLDVFFAFPVVLLAILIAGALGPGPRNQMIAIAFILIPYMTRVVRTQVETLRRLEFVEAARATGATTREIIVHELLPNVIAPLVVYATILVGFMILVAAGLSFFGLGANPPTADWGNMVNTGKGTITTTPHVVLMPSLTIVIVALAFNFVGDGLRNALEPEAS
ncbi:MAG: peptide ABC transporter substrate-binding protein [Thermomicrobiales bacterium]|nr:MAG: peptide ABC transporter substrate-binding protein [Thermomicrobiales bacterium]